MSSLQMLSFMQYLRRLMTEYCGPATLNGYQIGAVTNIGPTEDYSGVKVEMNVKSDASIPKNALAMLVQPSLMGESR